MSEQSGHNSNSVLISIVERVENVNESIKEFQQERTDIFLEGKSQGLDVKALRTVIRLRAMSPDDRAAQQQVLETYMHALGIG